MLKVTKHLGALDCHAECNEASRYPAREILRCAQDDKWMVQDDNRGGLKMTIEKGR